MSIMIADWTRISFGPQGEKVWSSGTIWRNVEAKTCVLGILK